MRRIFFLGIITVFCIQLHAQESKKDDGYEVSFNDKSHTIVVGDTIHVGYGATPYGSFMYIFRGYPPTPLDKRYAGQDGIVKKIKYYKSTGQHQIYIKGKFGEYVVELPQAVVKGEVAGFNQTYFK